MKEKKWKDKINISLNCVNSVKLEGISFEDLPRGIPIPKNIYGSNGTLTLFILLNEYQNIFL